MRGKEQMRGRKKGRKDDKGNKAKEENRPISQDERNVKEKEKDNKGMKKIK